MHFSEIFGQKQCLFGSKTVFLGQEVHYYMVYMAYFTELNLKIWDYAQNDAFVAKIVITRLTKGFMAIFAPAESLPSPATLFCNMLQSWPHHPVFFLNRQEFDCPTIHITTNGSVLLFPSFFPFCFATFFRSRGGATPPLG